MKLKLSVVFILLLNFYPSNQKLSAEEFGRNLVKEAGSSSYGVEIVGGGVVCNVKLKKDMDENTRIYCEKILDPH